MVRLRPQLRDLMTLPLHRLAQRLHLHPMLVLQFPDALLVRLELQRLDAPKKGLGFDVIAPLAFEPGLEVGDLLVVLFREDLELEEVVFLEAFDLGGVAELEGVDFVDEVEVEIAVLGVLGVGHVCRGLKVEK